MNYYDLLNDIEILNENNITRKKFEAFYRVKNVVTDLLLI